MLQGSDELRFPRKIVSDLCIGDDNTSSCATQRFLAAANQTARPWSHIEWRGTLAARSDCSSNSSDELVVAVSRRGKGRCDTSHSAVCSTVRPQKMQSPAARHSPRRRHLRITARHAHWRSAPRPNLQIQPVSATARHGWSCCCQTARRKAMRRGEACILCPRPPRHNCAVTVISVSHGRIHRPLRSFARTRTIKKNHI